MADIYVDEIGVGRGVADRLRELSYSVKPFNASKRASTEARQFTYANLRAEAYARLRDKMIRGEVGLPYSPELEQELRTARVPEQLRQAPDSRQGRVASAGARCPR